MRKNNEMLEQVQPRHKSAQICEIRGKFYFSGFENLNHRRFGMTKFQSFKSPKLKICANPRNLREMWFR